MNETYLVKTFLTKKEFRSAMDKVDKRLDNLDNSVDSLKKSVGILKNSVLRIEERLSYYGDMYEINKWHAEKLANRVNKLEKHNGITPPQDFLISGI